MTATVAAPVRAARFCYLDHQLDPQQNSMVCRYRLDDTDFAETYTFPGGGDWTAPAVTEAARIVFLLAGVSYYKAGAPPVIDLGDTAVTDPERAFLREYYIDGLGEFAFRQQPQPLDLTDLQIIGPVLDRPGPVGYTATTGKPLLPFGGGVDSIVSLELIRPRSVDPALFVVSRPGDHFAAIEDVAGVAGLPIVRVGRAIDDKIMNAGRLGLPYFNGHVPVTGILSALAVMAAALGGFDAVVMSNEWSASVGNVVVDGRTVNHQYSKSEAFEHGLRTVVAEAIGPSLDYFSLLRPFTELWIARRFAALPQYFSTFRSCNKAFALNPELRLDHWCGVCDKCAFIDLIVAPFMDAATLREVFDGHEPLDNPDMIEVFRTLLDLSGDTKPWECVGDVTECRIAAGLAADRPDRAGSPVLAELTAGLTPPDTADIAGLLRPVGRHFIPDRYAPADLLG